MSDTSASDSHSGTIANRSAISSGRTIMSLTYRSVTVARVLELDNDESVIKLRCLASWSPPPASGTYLDGAVVSMPHSHGTLTC